VRTYLAPCITRHSGTIGTYEVLLHEAVWADPLLVVVGSDLNKRFTVATCKGAFAHTTHKDLFYEPGIEHITMLGTVGLSHLVVFVIHLWVAQRLGHRQ
jgi:hypothetical protein